MPSSVLIDKVTLERLLIASGNKSGVEAFLTSPEQKIANTNAVQIQKRVRAAYWSRFWLLISAAISVSSFISGHDAEDFFAAVLLSAMTWVEFRVHNLFIENDIRAAVWGFRNQMFFSFLFLVYGGYHYYAPLEVINQIPAEFRDIAAHGGQMFYASVGLGGAAGQMILALYYKRATPFMTQPPFTIQ